MHTILLTNTYRVSNGLTWCAGVLVCWCAGVLVWSAGGSQCEDKLREGDVVMAVDGVRTTGIYACSQYLSPVFMRALSIYRHINTYSQSVSIGGR